MNRRVIGAAIATVLAATTLSACVPAPNPDWTAPEWPATVLTVATPPAPIESADLGLVARRIRNDDVGVQARWLQPPGAGAGAALAVDTVRGVVRAHGDAIGVPYAPHAFDLGAGMEDRGCVTGSTAMAAAEIVADPRLGPADGTGVAVACDVVAVAGPIVAQRLRIVTADAGAVVDDAEHVLYADTATGDGVPAAQLWADSGVDALWTQLVETLRRDAGSLSLAPVAPADDAARALLARALASTVPGDGALLVTVPAGFTAPELVALGIEATSEPVTVAIPLAAATSWLSPFGAAVATAVGAPYQAPAQIPAGGDLVGCDLVPCVAMTYDDGPSDLTSGILDELAQRRASATFFVLGASLNRYADVARRAVDEGHLVENHTWNHPSLPSLSAAGVAGEIGRTNAAILEVTGVPAVAFRPPYGDLDQGVLAAAGMAAILWDVDTNDWQQPADDELYRRAVAEARPGSIVLQHDVHANTGRTAGRIYDGLAERGFVLVNLRQLFDGEIPLSGAWRSAR